MKLFKLNLQLHANPLIPTNGTHELRERYADIIVALLRKQLVTNEEDIFSTDYEGSAKAGAVKVPVRDTEVSVRDYDIAAGLAPEQGATTYLTITIGNNKAVNEIIDGFEAAAVPDDLVAQRLDSAAYAMALTVDTDAITVLEAEGTTSANTTASTATTAYDNFLDEQEELDLVDVPRDGRYAIASPGFAKLMKKDSDFVSATSDLGFQEVKKMGLIREVDGVMFYQSNNMAASTEFILGHKAWTQRVMEWMVTPFLADLNGSANYIGASAIKGRMIFEHTVTRAVAVRIKTFV